jgi:predicted glycosyltransferase
MRPDVLISISGVFIVHVGKLTGVPAIVCDDTEHARLSQWISFPFASVICTPSCFQRDLGKKQYRYDGYHELAYLHPNRFVPNESVLDELDLSKDEKLIVVRFVSWGASHDIGHSGFSLEGKRELIRRLSKLGRVIITAEPQLPADLEPYRMRISPTKIHDVLAFSTLYIGEGATMASEAALLGIPCIYVNPLTVGYLVDQEKYGLVYRHLDENEAIERAITLINTSNTRAEWQNKRQRLLRDKIDVTAWMIDCVEKYVLEGEVESKKRL